MKIIKLILHKYKRFDLLGSDTITYTPESAYQLILGKNGIGKSSLLNELSPLPCEATDLKEGGYKYIEVEHRGKRYQLKNTLENKLNSSFICDGVELNDGRTIKVQKALVLEHFQYNQELHDLFIGFELFTNMSPQTRRHWFIQMSQSDMTYALGLFNKLKSSERDIRGAIKLNNERLVKEKASLPDNNEVTRLETEQRLIKDELNQLLPLLDKQLVDVFGRLHEVARGLDNLSHQVVDASFEIECEGVKDLDGLKELKTRFEYEVNYGLTEYKNNVDKLTELQDIVAKRQNDSQRTLHEIDIDIENVEKEREHASQAYLDYGIEVSKNIENELFEFDQISYQLTSILSQLPVNYMDGEDRRFTERGYDCLRNKINHLNGEKIKIANRISLFEREVQGMKDVHDVTCTNCQHVFKPGIDCNRILKGEEAIKQQRELLEQTRQQVSKEMQYLDEYENYRKWERAFKSLPDKFPNSYPLIRYLLSLDMIHDNPVGLTTMVTKYRNALMEASTLERCNKRLIALQQERDKVVALNGMDFEYIEKTIKQLEIETVTIQQRIEYVNQRIRQVRDAIISHERLDTLEYQIKTTIKELEDLTLQHVKYMNNQKLLLEVDERRNKLTDIEVVLSRAHHHQDIVKQFETMNANLEEEQHLLNVLLTILNPKDGLIAESLLGFMNQFLDQIANILDQVWTYPLRPYLDLGEEGIELDYRFPVDVNDGDIFVKDISRLSRGQMEIVNFAFKLLIMRYLDRQDFPLIMDEVGASFDALHRDRLYKYIKLLVESNQVQQVFIISHIASSHDALSNADKCVLDRDAVMMDDTINKVLKFE